MDAAPFTVYAHHSLILADDAEVFGDVAVRDASAAPYAGGAAEAVVATGARIAGALSADSVVLGAVGRVDGPVTCNDIAADPAATLSQSVVTPVALPIEMMFLDPPAAGAEPPQGSIVVQPGSTTTVSPGVYASLEVLGSDAASPGVLRLDAGVFHVGHLSLGAHSRLEFAGPVYLIVAGTLDAATSGYLGVATDATATTVSDTGVVVLGADGGPGTGDVPAAGLGDEMVVRTKLWVPNGSLQVGADAYVRGGLAARWIHIGPSAVVTRPGAACGHGVFSVAMECDDGDTCTVDTCDTATGLCGHVEQPGCDNTPPTWPAGASLTVEQAASTAASLAWPPAADDVQVAGYRVARNGQPLPNVPASQTTLLVPDLVPVFVPYMTPFDTDGAPIGGKRPLFTYPPAADEGWHHAPRVALSTIDAMIGYFRDKDHLYFTWYPSMFSADALAPPPGTPQLVSKEAVVVGLDPWPAVAVLDLATSTGPVSAAVLGHEEHVVESTVLVEATEHPILELKLAYGHGRLLTFIRTQGSFFERAINLTVYGTSVED